MNTVKLAEIDQSLRSCIKEGVASQVMTGIFDYYLNPLAIFLKATTVEIGFLASIPSVLSAFSQIFAVTSVHWVGSRKGLLTKGSLLQAFLLLPLPFLLFVNIPHRVIYLLVLVGIFRMLGSLMGPAWGSMVSDYLPEHLRGAYFGKRAQIISVAGMAALGIWGIFLYFLKGLEGWGFFVIFLFAAACRFVSAYYMGRLTEMPATHRLENISLRRINNRNFHLFVVYVAAVTFTTQMVSPYTSVYMLSDLKFSYLSYMGVNMVSLMSGLISFPLWGRNADLVGNIKIMKLTGGLICVAPILYMFAHLPSQLMMIEMFNGFVWGGFNLCATNFIYDAAPSAKRVQYLCYSNIINGASLFAGAALGGFLAAHLPVLNGSHLFFLFLISASGRLLARLLIFPYVKEVRKSYQKVNSSKLFFSVLGIQPLLGHGVEAYTLPDPWHKGLFHILRWLFYWHIKKKIRQLED